MDIDVTVKVVPCGQVNAFYWPSLNTVTLCQETLALGEDVVSAILNHELAHAYFDQHAIPTDDEEFAADELSFFFLTGAETLAITRLHLSLAETSPGEQGVHPGFLERAAMFICLTEGLMDTDRQCRAYYRSAFDKWTIAIKSNPNVER